MQQLARWSNTGSGRIILEASVFLVASFLTLGWVLPGVSEYTFGADYLTFPIRHQLVGMYSWAHGTWPAYVPGFAGGQSAAALTLGQLYSPLTHAAALLPGYWEGSARDIHSWLSLVLLAITNWAVFRLLRRLQLPWSFAFVLSFVAVFNLRTADLFRFGASLQNYLGTLLLCTAILRFPLTRGGFFNGIAITLATYILLTGGHPQIAYLGMLNAGFIWLLTPLYLKLPTSPPRPEPRPWLRELATIAGWTVVGVILSSAYLLPFLVDFLPSNSDRAAGSFVYAIGPLPATMYTWVASFFVPFRAVIHSSFGGSSLLVLGLLSPLVLLIDRGRVRAAIFMVWSFLLVVFCLTLGEMLPFYRWFWEYFPFAQSFRIPGRMTMLVAFPATLLLAWLLRSGAKEEGVPQRARLVQPYGYVAIAALALYLAYPWLVPEGLGAGEPAPAVQFNPDAVSWEGFVKATGAVALLAIACTAVHLRPWAQTTVSIIMITAVVAQTGVLLRFGNIVAAKRPTVSWVEMEERVKKYRGYAYPAGAGMASAVVSEHRKRLGELEGFRPARPRLFFQVKRFESVDEAYQFLVERPGRRFLGRRAAVLDLPAKDARELQSRKGVGSVRLEEGNNNRLRFAVDTNVPALLTLSEPYLAHWRATIDGKEVRTWRAEGSELAVIVPAGMHLVEIRYDTWATLWGLRITFATAGLLLLVGAGALSQPPLRWCARIGIVLFVLYLVSGLDRALDGPDLGWEYSWNWPWQEPLSRASGDP